MYPQEFLNLAKAKPLCPAPGSVDCGSNEASTPVEIPDSLKRLEQRLDTATSLVAELHDRLSPVLRQSVPVACVASLPSLSGFPTAPIAMVLTSYSGRVSELIDRVRDILHHLEV